MVSVGFDTGLDFFSDLKDSWKGTYNWRYRKAFSSSKKLLQATSVGEGLSTSVAEWVSFGRSISGHQKAYIIIQTPVSKQLNITWTHTAFKCSSARSWNNPSSKM